MEPKKKSLKHGYKKIIRDKEMRIKILDFLKFIPDSTMISLQYFIKFGRFPDLKNPKRFTEKLNWYKLHHRDPRMTQAADKYEVRKYVESKGLGHILNELYQVYDSTADIKVEDLPEKFVMKTTNGSGTNYFCTDKSNFDLETVKAEMDVWLKRNIFSSGREWSYKDIKPRIIVEALLEEENSEFDGINDYKIFCFNGQPSHIVLDVDRSVAHKRDIYDLNWQRLDISTDQPNIGRELPRPENLDEMLSIAEKLSEDFPFARVDLYSVNNKVYFGEITFYPWTGYIQFNPDEFDYILGEKLKCI